jgi:hypothetical protein
MSDNKQNFDPVDPLGVMKGMRDQSMNNWAKMMVELVNSEAYAEANGAMLDSWLSSSGPMRKAMENALAQSLANFNLPSRDEVARLAERMTNVEMRLDDMDAKCDEILEWLRKTPAKKAKSARQENEA